MGTTNVLVMKPSRLIHAYKNILHYKEHFIKVAAQKKKGGLIILGLLYWRFSLSRISYEKGLVFLL